MMYLSCSMYKARFFGNAFMVFLFVVFGTFSLTNTLKKQNIQNPIVALI